MTTALLLTTWLPLLLAGLLITIALLIFLFVKWQYRNMSRDKKYYNNLFEHATEGIILTDNKARIFLVNPAAQKIFGYSEEEMTGKSIELLIPQKYHHNHRQHQTNYYKHPQVRPMGKGRDLSAVRKDGSEFPVEVSLSYFKDKGKTFVIAFVMDITVRKQAEERLIQANKELLAMNEETQKLNEELENKVSERTLMLQEALQQVETSLEKERELSDIKSRFVSMASHEFRTPLSTVLFSASLLGKYLTTEEQDKRNRHIHKIKESVKHLNAILEDFLSLGKLNEGHIAPSFQEFSVKELIEAVLEEMNDLLKPGQKFIFTSDRLSLFYSDSRLLKNILINLLSNAIKYSPDQSAIRVEASYNDRQLTINIRDKGIGISREDQEHLFSSFFRGKNATNIKGTGLGLHIVKRYLDLLGGEVALQSEENKGTTVTIIIPEHPQNV